MSSLRYRLSRPAAAAVAGLLVAGLLCGGAALAAYPGANGKIAFQSGQAGSFDIWSMEADGNGLTNLTNDPSHDDWQPIWSPNGARIAFVKSSEGHKNIWVMNADGSGQTNLTRGPAGGGRLCGSNGKFGLDPSWSSPTGSKIAYSVSGDIFVMRANGRGKKNITCTNNLHFYEDAPAWSPVGNSIAYRYQSDDAGVYHDIWVMASDGSNCRPLTSTPAPVAESFPDWSPDGTKIVYQRSHPGGIWKMNADGSNQTMLIGGELGKCGRDPVWSPDGTKIVFSSNCFDSHNGYDIFVMDPDGSDVTRVPSPEPPAGDFYPSWQPL